MKETCTLALESIEAIRDKVEHELTKDKAIAEQRVSTILMLMEELMLVYRNAYGEQCTFHLESKTSRKERIFTMRFAGDELDPSLDARAHELRTC